MFIILILKYKEYTSVAQVPQYLLKNNTTSTALLFHHCL